MMRAEPDGFEELWLLWREYARKSDGRGKARPTYNKWLLDGTDPRDIIDGARWHLRSMKPEECQYIQLLSVYLNSEKWADECEKERKYQEKLASQATNVVQIKAAPLPENHFSRKWEQLKSQG